MAIRRINPGLIKIHRSYTIEEAARALGVHKNTVTNWLKDGLDCIDDRRPRLVQGKALKSFLRERRRSQKQQCGPGELYCLKCRKPVIPLDGKVVYIALNEAGGNLQGRCRECLSIICRRISKSQLADFQTILTIQHRQKRPRINDRSAPSLNVS